MNTDTFAPFVPPTPMFDETKPADPPKVKKERKKRPAAESKKPRKKKTVVQPGPVAQVAAAIERGKKRKTKTVRAPKFSLADALQIGALLQPDDLKPFGEIEHMLRSLSKGSRGRILAAIGRVFE